VAVPVLEIEKDPNAAYEYTNKGNLVGSYPMAQPFWGWEIEAHWPQNRLWKVRAFSLKKFAGIDVYDIEVDTHDPELFIKIVTALGPTFGGINLEDIKSPECS